MGRWPDVSAGVRVLSGFHWATHCVGLLWSLRRKKSCNLTFFSPIIQESAEAEKAADKSKSRRKSVSGSHSFQEMVKTLPNKLSKHMAENLSVPIAFVCLLHLANEKVCVFMLTFLI